jgi:hypothetical protein
MPFRLFRVNSRGVRVHRAQHVAPLLLILFTLLSVWQAQTQQSAVFAQESTSEATEPEPTDDVTVTPPVSIISSEPLQGVFGQVTTLSVFGANFTNQTTVRLVGFGLLTVTFVNSGALTAIVPNNVAPGQYLVEISDPARGSATSPNTFTVLSPTNTPMPPSAPTATIPPPTFVPGAPALLIRSYVVNPSTVAPGGSFTITVEVVNQGTRAAQGISVTIATGGSFFAANGQANALLPDISPGGSTIFSLAAAASTAAVAGPNPLALTFTYRDFEGTAGTSTQNLTVNVQEVSQASQVTLARYMINPSPVVAGEAVDVTLLIMNSGNETAVQALVKISTDEGAILLPGPDGDSFPLGDIAPGASVGIEIPLRVNAEADPGPQLQQITISYLQNGEAQTVTASMTIEVSETQAPAPLFLLAAYDTGDDTLQPGDRFTLTINLQNAGNNDANDVLLTYGTVDNSSTDSGTPTGGGSSANTTFAPVGAGGTTFIGAIASGETIELEQDFVVNGTVTSGIYNLNITLRYTKPDGTAAQENLRASIVVIVPPRIRLRLEEPLPDPAMSGEPFSFSLGMINFGRNDLILTFANVEVENGEVLDGDEAYLGVLRGGGGENSVDAVIMPSEEGTVTITVSIHYLDDFNQEQTIVETYEVEAEYIEPTDEFFPDGGMGENPNFPPVEMTPEPVNTDWIGSFILGFFGLGS